jgi:DNA-binding XRE family transcriptional regulator
MSASKAATRTQSVDDINGPDDIDLSRAKVVRRGPKGPVRLPLRAIREGARRTQAEVASALGVEQSVISRLEGRSDAHISTLRKYAAAIGATCEVTFVFPTGHRLVLAEPEDDKP